jgi:tight adherence protein C
MFPLICFILPAMVIVVVGPGIIKIARNLFPAFGGG